MLQVEAGSMKKFGVYAVAGLMKILNIRSWISENSLCVSRSRIHLASFSSRCHTETIQQQYSKAVTLHTDLGDLKLELHCEQCPRACENFLALCASGYYNGCIFHRNIKGFLVQTGDPTGTGKGGKSIWGSKFEDEFHDSLRHNARGIVSMANNGPDANGSQFFITYAKQSQLDLKYTIFAKVIDGLEVLDSLEVVPVKDTKQYRPTRDIRIEDVTIHANPLAEAPNEQV